MKGVTRAWSIGVLRSMLDRLLINYRLTRIHELSIDDYNDLGDWAYYRLNPGDMPKNSRFRHVPPFLDKIIKPPKKNKVYNEVVRSYINDMQPTEEEIKEAIDYGKTAEQHLKGGGE
jgi:hypothetical protein